MKKIIINSESRVTRVAVLEDRRLVDLFIEYSMQSGQTAGSIYKGRVADVLPGMQAAFIDIGLEKNAFLFFDDEENGPFPRRGDELLVRVSKESMGDKGARVTTKLTFPGRYIVYIPNREETGVSRQIEDHAERERLHQIAREICPRGEGIIIRTAARQAGRKELEEELLYLRKNWNRCLNYAETLTAPALEHRDLTLLLRAVRGLMIGGEEELWVDHSGAYRQLLWEVENEIPGLRNRIHIYRETKPIFEAFGIESEVEKLLRKKVWLKSGGYIVIDRTEALTAIDVNTGKFTGKETLEETVLKINLEAAEEIARQVRLRDIGGMIVIDFISMKDAEDRNRVVQTFQDQVAKDRARTCIFGFTKLGLLEMTRKQVRVSLSDLLLKKCDCCGGTGRVLSEKTVISQMEREIKSYARGGHVEAVLIEAHPRINAQFVGTGGEALKRMEERLGIEIYLNGCESLRQNEFSIALAGSVNAVKERALPVHNGEVLPVRIVDRHPNNEETGISRINGYVVNVDGAGKKVGSTVLAEITGVYKTYARARLTGAYGGNPFTE